MEVYICGCFTGRNNHFSLQKCIMFQDHDGVPDLIVCWFDACRIVWWQWNPLTVVIIHFLLLLLFMFLRGRPYRAF